MRDLEKRFVKGMELRLSGSDKNPVLKGYIAHFDSLSEDFGGWREKIAPGAFNDTLRSQDIRALWNHENDLVLGRTSAGTLDLWEDPVGLAFKNRPPDTTWFRDRMVSLMRRDVTGSSFTFYTDADEWGTGAYGTRVRTLKKVTLVEVSPGVTFPAYPQPNTEVARRSLERWLGAGGQDMEARLRRHRLRARQLGL
jgi:Escherichia/Staphylococcus phage prohead protease